MKPIRFRIWRSDENRMLDNDWLVAAGVKLEGLQDPWDFVKVMQFTGFQDSNKKDIYEFDIKRETNETDDGDEVDYYVCCWIKEWGMFAWLSIDAGEYTKWLHTGANDLDTTMFWTYTLEHSDEDTVCGNIFQNPKFLTPELL